MYNSKFFKDEKYELTTDYEEKILLGQYNFVKTFLISVIINELILNKLNYKLKVKIRFFLYKYIVFIWGLLRKVEKKF